MLKAIPYRVKIYMQINLKERGVFMAAIQLTLKTMKKWFEPENDSPKRLYNTLPFQRKAGIWNSITKSMFARSVIQDNYIPPIVFLKTGEEDLSNGKSVAVYQIEDGQQRLTALFDFLDGKYALHSSSPDAEVDNEIYELGGKYFDDLQEECKDSLQNHSFSVFIIEDYNDTEAEELFYLINSGVALSPVQKSKARMGTDNIRFFNLLLSGEFFTQAINMSFAQTMKEDDLLTLVQASMLFDARDGVYDCSKGIGAPACLAYASSIYENFSKEQKMRLSEVVSYLDKAFSGEKKVKFLSKNNLPVVIVNAYISFKSGNDPELFKHFIYDFAGEDGKSAPDRYKSGGGAGNVKLPKVNHRLYAMYEAMEIYFSTAFEDMPFDMDDDELDELIQNIGYRTDEYIVSEKAKEEMKRKKGEAINEEENADEGEESDEEE